MSGAGDLVRGNATSGAHVGVGHYAVGFARNVTGCSYNVTLGSVDATPPPPGGTRAVDEGGKVGIYLNDLAGNPVDGMFYLSVTCAP
jgi:peptidoglycan hydrolase-like protein with peptidoglycan-binding domain